MTMKRKEQRRKRKRQRKLRRKHFKHHAVDNNKTNITENTASNTTTRVLRPDILDTTSRVRRAATAKLERQWEFTSRVRRAATARPERLWDFGIIPYEIESNFSGQHKALFKLAMRHWENYTCLSFIEKQPEHTNYIVFTEKPCG